MKILFAASEMYPLIKTGGLADVAWSLPRALAREGNDVHVVLPAYHELLKKVTDFRIVGWLAVPGVEKMHKARIMEVRDKGFDAAIWLVDIPELFCRLGNPYSTPEGYDWPDNAERFASFSRAVAALAVDEAGIGWSADVVHSNDWQTGLVSAFLSLHKHNVVKVFTIHNLAYGGHYSHEEFNRLKLPWEWWSHEALEFYNGFSMLKGGIIFSDQITTVSPTYAQEICTPEFGYGFEGLLRSRQHKLSGILNGIDTEEWDPASDPLIPHHYQASQPDAVVIKRKNRQALLRELGAPARQQRIASPVLGFIGRLVEQKGIDLLLHAIPALLDNTNARFVILGSGQADYEQRLATLSARHPDRVYTYIGYSEQIAHKIEAGSDLFLMPSRFEPCGLNQMYSLRYGTPPVVHRTGGLADTVTHATEESIKAGEGTGFVFEEQHPQALIDAVTYALSLRGRHKLWRQLVDNAMRQQHDWAESARHYLKLYRQELSLKA